MSDKVCNDLAQACERYRKHLAACGGDQTAALFAGSPYSRTKRGEHWEWDEEQLRCDQAALADAYVADHAHQQLSMAELTERFYAVKSERDLLRARHEDRVAREQAEAIMPRGEAMKKLIERLRDHKCGASTTAIEEAAVELHRLAEAEEQWESRWNSLGEANAAGYNEAIACAKAEAGGERVCQPCQCGSPHWARGGILGAHCCRCDRNLIFPWTPEATMLAAPSCVPERPE